jgi:hypothetical protein
MSKLSVSHVYGSTADRVWAVIGNPGSLASWHPAIASSPAEGGQRTCTLADGGVVKEEITAHDDSARSYTYRIVESPLPMTGYVSTIRVEPTDGGRAKVVWEAEFEAAGIEPAKLEEMLRGLYTAGLGALESKLS